MYSNVAYSVYLLSVILIVGSLPIVLFCKYYAFAAVTMNKRIFNTISIIADESLRDILFIYLFLLIVSALLAYAWLAVISFSIFLLYLLKRVKET